MSTGRGNVGIGTPGRHVDVIVPVTGAEVDVLFVVDNSCSMNEHAEDLANNAAWFVQRFVETSVDYHVGVVTTDLVDPEQSGRLRTAFGQRWVEPGSANAVDALQGMLNVGVDGAFPERGLGAIVRARVDEAEYNAGFWRENATLHAMVVSDERDFTFGGDDPEDLAAFVDWFDGLKRSPFERTFTAIDDEQFGPSGPGGIRYAQVAEAIGGSVQPIDASDWTAALVALGLRAVSVGDTFFLSREPVPRSIEVSLRPPSEQATRLPGSDWEYDAARNAVVLAVPPESDRTEVHIAYRLR